MLGTFEPRGRGSVSHSGAMELTLGYSALLRGYAHLGGFDDMQFSKTFVFFVFAAVLAATVLAPRVALADGKASTRNIFIGAAAAAAGTLLIINHNKKVHERYAEDDRRQAQTQAAANQSEAAYDSEKQAYGHEVAIVAGYQHEVAVQHAIVKRQDAQIASLQHSLTVAKASARPGGTTFVQTAAHVTPAKPPAGGTAIAQQSFEPVSYGWGTF